MRRRGTVLTLDGFRAAGGVVGAIAQSAEHAYERLDEPERAAARRLFMRLVTPGEDSPDTRRRLSWDEIDDSETRDLVDTLATDRLLTVDDRGVELVHETLIRSWPRLRAWIDENRDELRSRQRITQSAMEWSAHRKDPDLLYRGARLATAVEWRARANIGLPEPSSEFLDASVAAQDAEAAAFATAERRRRQVRRFAFGALSLLAIAAIVASTVAYVALRRSQDKEAEAEDRFGHALGTQAESLAPTQPKLAMLLAAESAARVAPMSAEAQQALANAHVRALRDACRVKHRADPGRGCVDGTGHAGRRDDGDRRARRHGTTVGHRDRRKNLDAGRSGRRHRGGGNRSGRSLARRGRPGWRVALGSHFEVDERRAHRSSFGCVVVGRVLARRPAPGDGSRGWRRAALRHGFLESPRRSLHGRRRLSERRVHHRQRARARRDRRRSRVHLGPRHPRTVGCTDCRPRDERRLGVGHGPDRPTRRHCEQRRHRPGLVDGRRLARCDAVHGSTRHALRRNRGRRRLVGRRRVAVRRGTGRPDPRVGPRVGDRGEHVDRRPRRPDRRCRGVIRSPRVRHARPRSRHPSVGRRGSAASRGTAC